MDWTNTPTLALGITSVAVVGGLIALGVRYLEARSRRDEDATRLQQALSELLSREPALAGADVVPLVSLSLRGLVRVELTGSVRSVEVRDAAVRATEREATRLGRRMRVIDRLQVVDAMRRPA